MKKTFVCASAVAILLSLCGCGAGTTKNLASNALNTSSLSAAGLASTLGTVISELLKSQTSAADIVGTWTYTQPKIVFESENILSQLGSTIASSKVESTLSKQLEKIGFTAGKTSLVMKNDMQYELVIGKKTYSGTYTFDAQSSKLVLQGSLGLSTLSCTATIKGNELYLLFDADKLLSFITGFAGKSSNLSTLSSILSSYSGLKMGWTMVRQ